MKFDVIPTDNQSMCLESLKAEFACVPPPEDLEFTKSLLRNDGLKLKELLAQESNLDHQLKGLKSEIYELKEKMRALWLPFVRGADRADMELDGVNLSMQKILDVSIDLKEEAVNWFLENGYNGVCKYDVHSGTMKKIAKEEYDKGTEIPGLQYKEVQILKIK